MAPHDSEHADMSENDIKVAIAKENGLKDRKKRRSKSGCRTCRKRRVKCDEGRPICANCIKSKRSCEGYAPMFSFIYPRYPAAAPAFPVSNGSQTTTYTRNPSHDSPASTLLPLIRPRPRESHPSENHYKTDRPAMHLEGTESCRTVSSIERPLPLSGPFQRSQIGHSVALNAISGSDQAGVSTSSRPSPTARSTAAPRSQFSTTSTYNSSDERSKEPAQRSPHDDPTANSGTEIYRAVRRHVSTPPNQDTSIRNIHAASRQEQDLPSVHPTSVDHITMDFEYGAIPRQFSHVRSNYMEHLNIAQILEDAAVETQDDNYYDVNSDDEGDELSTSVAAYVQDTNLHRNRATLLEANAGPFGSRTSEVLQHYSPDLTANPLRNSETTFVFTHFVVSTAPTLSLHNRNLPTPLPEISPSASSCPQLKLWTEAIPALALHNSSLLHAILAVSSLQLARVYKTAVTPSLKHYAYSLKRVHHSVSHERKRHEVATLAATLLLAHYEVMQADHSKWSTHLHGAAQLLDEFDHVGIEARMQELATPQEKKADGGSVVPTVWPRPLASSGLVQEEVWNADWSHVEAIAGLSCARFDHLKDGSKHLPTTPNNLQDLRVLQDLCWWYRRQDVYYSLISGNALLQKYSQWSKCPPRGPLGNVSNVCGTMDYLTLLLGRLANFIVADRARKLRILENNSGTWPIPRSSDISQTDDRREGGQLAQSPIHQPMPPFPNLSFYGMAPTTSGARMPRAFEAKQPAVPSDLHPATILNDMDIETATHEAECQWSEIRKAFVLFAEELHFGFSPLESNGTVESAFGPVASYASYAIADIWMQYYMGLIILTRSHPSMPPAAQISVGAAAPQTSAWATTIGRIAAGLMPDGMNPDLSSWHAALMTCTLPLFFAGVQYQDELQRMWTIRRLRDAEAATGWASAGLCAHGCESAWVAASQAGRGPPYQRSFQDDNSEDQRVSGRYLHLTGMPPTDPVDRRFIPYDARARLVWAVGILGTEEDFSKMSLKEGE